MAYYLWVLRLPAESIRASWYWEFYFFCLLLFGLRAPQKMLRWLLIGWWPLPQESRRWFLPWISAIIVLGSMAAENRWPLKLAVYLSRPAFDRLADEAIADPNNASSLSGRWVGLYRIGGVQVVGTNLVALHLRSERGNYGFLRMPNGPAHIQHFYENYPDHPEQPAKPYEGGGDAIWRVARDWYVMFNSYWAVKDGWSSAGTAFPHLS